MAETHDKDRNRKQTKETKQQVSRAGLKTASQEKKDSASSSQIRGNTDQNTHDT